MLGFLFVAVTGQFDFGGGKAHLSSGKARLPSYDYLLTWDIVQTDVEIKATDPRGTVRFGANPPTLKPYLGPRYFHDVVLDFPTFGKLSLAHKRRLRELYIQSAGSEAIQDPRIAKTIGLAKPLPLPPAAFGTGRWPIFRREGPDTPDLRIQNSLAITKMFRDGEIATLIRDFEFRRRLRALLSDNQRRRLEELAGKPIRAAFYESRVSFGLPAYRPSDGSEQASLQYEGAFSVLRHDVARRIGLDEDRVGRILIAVERIAVQALSEADEYWWLLKERGSEGRIASLRANVFREAEIEARKAILGLLSDGQRKKWITLSGPPIAGLKTRNHFG